MSKIVKNITLDPYEVVDCGVTIPAEDEITISPNNYDLWAGSSNVITGIGGGDLIINDGSQDLSVSDGIDLIKAIFPKKIAVGNSDLSQTMTFLGDCIKTDTTFSGYSSPEMFLLAVRKGKIPGHSIMRKFGENEHISVSGEDVWNNPDNISEYPFPLSAVTVELSSANNNDASTGTGVRTIQIYGLDVNYAEQNEIITLNGISIVESVNTYRRVHRMIGRSFGSSGHNEGTIKTCNKSTSECIAAISETENQTMMAIYTMPAGKTGYIYKYHYSVSNNFTPEVWIKVRPFGEGFQVKDHVSETGGRVLVHMQWEKVNEKSDIKIHANASTGSHHLEAGFVILLVDNE